MSTTLEDAYAAVCLSCRSPILPTSYCPRCGPPVDGPPFGPVLIPLPLRDDGDGHPVRPALNSGNSILKELLIRAVIIFGYGVFVFGPMTATIWFYHYLQKTEGSKGEEPVEQTSLTGRGTPEPVVPRQVPRPQRNTTRAAPVETVKPKPSSGQGDGSPTLPRPTLITAVNLDGNNHPGPGEGADKAFDGTVHGSYTNLGGANSGIEFTYDRPTRLSSFVITTAHDPVGRHPTSYQVYAFNAGAWQSLTSGSLQIAPQAGGDSSPVVLPGLPSFTQYRVIFPTVREGSVMQIGELKLFGSQSTSP